MDRYYNYNVPKGESRPSPRQQNPYREVRQMVLQRWDQFGDLRRAETRFNRLFRGGGGAYCEPGVGSWAVPLDVIGDGDDIVVKASLPGVKADDVSVTIADGVLTIKAESSSEAEAKEKGYLLRERRYGAFHRSLRLFRRGGRRPYRVQLRGRRADGSAPQAGGQEGEGHRGEGGVTPSPSPC